MSSPGRSSDSDIDEEHAFELVCRHMRTISRLHGAEFEDMVQTAAERVFRQLSSFEERASLSTWIFRVCYNVFLNEQRSHKRWLRRFTLTASGELPDRSTSPEPGRSLEWQERNARLNAALDAMSAKLSTVVVLHDLKSLSIQDICELLDINERTARSRLRNGRLELMRRLHRDPYFKEQSTRKGAQLSS